MERILFCQYFYLFAMVMVDGQFAGAQEDSQLEVSPDWIQSFDAGYIDSSGQFAGGSEIMHLVAHQGRVYAANGYWMDWHWEIPPDHQRQSAQVLRLDKPGDRWQVDLDMGKNNPHGLGYMKGNILKSVTFTYDHRGKKLAEAANLLVMAAGAQFERGGAVSAWVRNDRSGQWDHTLVRHGVRSGGVRWVPRDLQVYRDKVTGAEKIFLLLGNPGVITGAYDPDVPSRIRWSRNTEFPFLIQGSFRSRPLGMVEANGSLFFSVDDAIYRRIDGKSPNWEKVIQLGEDVDTDVGGVRGLTAVPHPEGAGESLLFVWAPSDQSNCQVIRLDPDANGQFRRNSEVILRDLMARKIGKPIGYTLAAHNMMYPVTDPKSDETVHLIGLQGNIRGEDPLQWRGSRLYGGAVYAVRKSDGTYTLQEVNQSFRPGSRPIVSARCFCLSPFGDQRLFIGGHDASNRVSSDLAWVAQVPVEVALGNRPGKISAWKNHTARVPARLTQDSVYELRTYVAAENRMQDLLTRFRKHTNQIFKKHNIQALGYWLPIGGPPIQKRKLVYLLKHPS
ncbi:MAG: NIPSNAP family protein, partial [Planctomycetota bacterium]|nr:NIPSNAP family protein [Planctomycetota bacterium]